MFTTMNYKIKPYKNSDTEQLVILGNYDYVNSNITSQKFPIEPIASQVELVSFGKYMSSDDVLKQLSEQGLRPANMSELLAFVAQYPEEQRQGYIAALGSVWRSRGNYRYVGCLWEDADVRNLYVFCNNDSWSADYRFLAACKSELGTSEPQPLTQPVDLGISEIVLTDGRRYRLVEEE